MTKVRVAVLNLPEQDPIVRNLEDYALPLARCSYILI